METQVYNREGKAVRELKLPEEVFAVAWNGNLVHQVVVAMQANARTSTAHTKDRSEVSGTGKKPWKQKGTGNARHGSRRSPIWRTGGVAHGPRNERDYSQKINRQMRVKALYTVLSQKLRDNEILFVDSLTTESPKAQTAKNTLQCLAGVKGFEAMATKKRNAALIALGAPSENTIKSYRNFGHVNIEEVRNLNPVEVLRYKFLVLAGPEEVLAFLASKKKTTVKKNAATTPAKKTAPKAVAKISKAKTPRKTKTVATTKENINK